ncbi:enoyl-CoA hydratase/isomerase family protein [Streptomyces sp. TRM66268-LWL]|uniref:3-hydroxyisobutyryl-CoA hydrolase n=1 Tax=Streptomyces polyasparticus TaxID=2767826 RepID=A0ABR7SS72_9ACTN|nr:enoyl-CoA hydratase/isomerase family protein [Streptomyces polyasparticus]MBC9717520.1 enoyl-CoA hydratase/isomerase family protein [Streptomyces polyasparticus]
MEPVRRRRAGRSRRPALRRRCRADDTDVTAIVLDGAGERGLCAGGDIRVFRESALGDPTPSRLFWTQEYALNSRIAHYPKPYVALMDGIVMGGGVGLSAHGSVRVVTERSRIAMPEVAIGFVPDVGGTWLLSRAPGELGTHLALTADAMTGADAIALGFADHCVPQAQLPGFLAALATRELTDAVRDFTRPARDSELLAHRDWIDTCYAADTVEEIVQRLTDSGVPAAKEAATRILGHSPTSLKVTLRALRRARRLPSLEAALDQELHIACATLGGPDLPEGVRALVVDKDRSPRWSPARLEDVDEATVARHFAP